MAKTYSDLRNAVLFYLQIPSGDEGDFTRGTTDMILTTVNAAIKTAQLRHDFSHYFSSNTVVTVSSPTSLDGYRWDLDVDENVVLKKIQGFFYTTIQGTMTPVPWTSRKSRADQLLREMEVTDLILPDERYTASAEESSCPQIDVSGKLFFTSGIPADTDITITGWSWEADLVELTDTNYFLDNGFNWLMWRTLIDLNYFTKQFVDRQEGNLGSPERLEKQAWLDLVSFDDNLYAEEKFIIE